MPIFLGFQITASAALSATLGLFYEVNDDGFKYLDIGAYNFAAATFLSIITSFFGVIYAIWHRNRKNYSQLN